MHELVYDKQVYDDYTVLTVDTAKTRFFNIKYHDLGDYGKRKLENLIVMKYPKQRLKFIYG